MIKIMNDTDNLIRWMLRHSNFKDLNNCPAQKQLEDDEQREQMSKDITEYHFSKADQLDLEPIQSIKISIDLSMPAMIGQSDCEEFHEQQARRISYLLRDSLPQGTFDRIIYELMGIQFQKYPSVFRGVTNS